MTTRKFPTPDEVRSKRESVAEADINAALSSATSSHFCTAKASQLFSSLSSLSSRLRSTGLCNSEQLGATHRRSPRRS